MSLPRIIQGGMGVSVSNWRLSRCVSQMGHLGVVSGTALAIVISRRLQDGDPEGHLRRAFGHFPIPEMAQRILDHYFIEGGKSPDAPYAAVPLYAQESPRRLVELTVVANFAEVFLAKEGHDGVVGINYLEKIQLPTLSSIYGAMLAGVDYILVGAGIPRAIPGILDQFAQGQAAKMRLDVEGALPGEEYFTAFDPQSLFGAPAPQLARPNFLAIVSSATLAMTLAKKSNGRVDGFVVEGSTAGGHNAPPRGPLQLTEKGEPLYGDRDIADLEKIRALGLPFWLAGGHGQPGGLAAALQTGATGIQVGTALAFCEESGIDPEIKRRVIEESAAGRLTVFTSPVASPTGFPFKVVQLKGSISDPDVYAARKRICDLGYLRQAYRKTDGTLGYRCPGELPEHYVNKGGQLSDTCGRICLCNGLLATASIGQVQAGNYHEPALVTAGDDVCHIARLAGADGQSYTAASAIARLLEGAPA